MENVKNSVKTKTKCINQRDIARELSMRFGLSLAEVESFLDEEARIVMTYVAKGYRITRKNYLTIKPVQMKARKFLSPITKKEYELDKSFRIIITPGLGFKTLVNNGKKMPKKLCRFVP